MIENYLNEGKNSLIQRFQGGPPKIAQMDSS
jgi:hypothetical protein